MASSAGTALSLIKAVLELVADRRTGVMDVKSEGLRTRIYFEDGRPLYAEDDAPGESFGRLLVRQGVITNDQFVRVIDEMTRAAAGSNQLRFGEVAVGLGVLTPEQVERGLGEQVCGIVARALQRGESQWAFEASPPAAKPPRSFSLELHPAIAAAMRQSPDRSAVAALVAARPDEVVLVAGPRPAPDVRADAGAPAAETHAARISAEQAFQKGLALLREAKIASAAVELRRASELQPESLEYQLFATWAKARSYREIPTESDREVLRELAHRAKRRDPMFAFGSFVIGQLAMWAGDEPTAKKWFYEALRLDPASEASKQVRILARRGPATLPAPGKPAAPEPRAAAPASGGPEKPAPTEAPALAPAPTEAPAPATKAPPAPALPAKAPAAKAAPGGGGKRLAAAAALLAIGAIVILAATRISAPRAGLAPAPSVPAATSVDSGQPVDAERDAGDAAPDGSAAAPSARVGEPPKMPRAEGAESPQTGTVLFPARATGHRIFVDGRRARVEETSDGIAPLRLRCGSRLVQIGSGGIPEPIVLPCGGEVQLQ